MALDEIYDKKNLVSLILNKQEDLGFLILLSMLMHFDLHAPCTKALE